MSRTTVGSRLWELLSHQIGQDEGTLQIVFGGIKDALLRGERLTVPDFGTFSLRSARATSKWQPKLGIRQEIPERRRLNFRASKAFSDDIRALV